jgi:hypothetical protein
MLRAFGLCIFFKFEPSYLLSAPSVVLIFFRWEGRVVDVQEVWALLQRRTHTEDQRGARRPQALAERSWWVQAIAGFSVCQCRRG